MMITEMKAIVLEVMKGNLQVGWLYMEYNENKKGLKHKQKTLDMTDRVYGIYWDGKD